MKQLMQAIALVLFIGMGAIEETPEAMAVCLAVAGAIAIYVVIKESRS